MQRSDPQYLLIFTLSGLLKGREMGMARNLLELVNISKSFGNDLVLDELNLEIREQEFLTLLGPSGCGKTTTLRIIGGFETPDTGKVIFEGRDITQVPANRRNLNTVFQNYALLKMKYRYFFLLIIIFHLINLASYSSPFLN